MKKSQVLQRSYLLTMFVLLYTLNYAQEIPASSPKSTISQRIGLHDVTIAYSRPAARGRDIFGSLVPYDQIWRTGANRPTFIELLDTAEVLAADTRINPGKYALYTIPNKNVWTVILSSDTTRWGAYGYDESKDVLRFQVKPELTPEYAENFTISFKNISEDAGTIQLHWEKTAVSFELVFDITHRVVMAVEQISQDKKEWGNYADGARYLLNKKMQLDRALIWIDKAILAQPYHGYIWTKAEILAETGQFDEALEAGKKALNLGLAPENKPYFDYELVYRKQLRIWENKVTAKTTD